MMKLFFIAVILASSIIAQELPFEDNFSDGDFNGWTVVDDEPQRSGPSNWLVQDGAVRQTSNIWAYDAPDEFKYHLGTHVYIGNPKWTDYSFNAIVRTTDDDGIGLLFRYNDNKNYYRLLLLQDSNNGGPFHRLQKFVNGEPVTLYEKRVNPALPKGDFALTVDARSDTLRAYINNELLAAVVDEQFIEGAVGLACYANSGAYFDSVLVSSERIVYEAPEYNEVLVNRAPYIQLPTPTSVLIAWRTTEKMKGSVEYGVDASLSSTVTEQADTNKHELSLSGLQPGTKYYYQTYNNGNPYSEIDSFVTVDGNTNKVSFLIWGDSGTATEPQYKIAELLTEEVNNVDFGIHVGDVSQSDGSEYDEIYFKPYKDIVSKINIYTCIGNHDTYFDDAVTYLDNYYLPDNNPQQTERYYSFTWGNTFFINIDSNIDYTPGSPQYEFIVSQLQSEEKENADWVFAYFHHPPYCELWDSWGGEEKVRQHLQPLFEEYDVDMVFNGHTHGYERGKLNGVNYVISGGGGGGLDTYARDWPHISVSEEKHNYTKVEIDDNSLTLKAIDIDGNEFDKIEIVKNITDIDNKESSIPNNYELKQNYPNPFNPSTTIGFSIPKNEHVDIKLYDMLGKEMTTIFSGSLNAGEYEVDFDSTAFSSGVYIYALASGNYYSAKKMVLLK